MKKNLVLTLGLFSCLSFASSIQASNDLPRKTFLGLSATNYDDGAAVVANNLHQGGTAHQLGIKKGDTILSINHQSVSDFDNLVEILSTIKQGSKLNVLVLRDGKKITLSAKSQGMPLEKGESYSVQYSVMTWQNERIRTIRYTPNTPRDDGASVFYIQGYSCNSIDYGRIPTAFITQLLAGFAEAGYNVLKMEKPGVGESVGELNCMKYDYSTEHAAFEAGLAHYKQLPGINANNVFVFGYSLGVLHASKIAEKGLAKGVIGYGGIVKSWHDYTRDIFSKQPVKYEGMTLDQAKKNTATISPFLADWLASDLPWREVLAKPTTQTAFDSGLISANGEEIWSRHFSYYRDINNYDFSAIWQNANAHALLLHGNYDIQAIEGDWATQVADLINKQGAFSGTAHFFDNTDHGMKRYKNKEDLMKQTRREARGLGKFNADITQVSIDWMNNVLATNHSSN